MTKEEFLDELRSSLFGNVSAKVINDNLNYYENFIDTQLRKGRSMDEVLEELGSPRLIAKTITDTAPGEERRTVDDYPDNKNDEDDNSFIMPWWMIIAVVFAVMLVIYLIFSLASLVLPVLIILGVVFFVVKVLTTGR